MIKQSTNSLFLWLSISPKIIMSRSPSKNACTKSDETVLYKNGLSFRT